MVCARLLSKGEYARKEQRETNRCTDHDDKGNNDNSKGSDKGSDKDDDKDKGNKISRISGTCRHTVTLPPVLVERQCLSKQQITREKGNF